MFAENLRDARKRKDITQKQAAEIFGVSQSTYALYEVGKREPSFETLMRMADYFGVSCDSLLGYNEKTPAVKTYSDVIRLLIPVMETGLFWFGSTWNDYREELPAISSDDESICAFMRRWRTMLEKKVELSFDEDLYSAWMEKQLRDSDRPIVRNRNAVQEVDDDDELPF